MENNSLAYGNIPKQIAMIAIPSSVGFFFNTMFNVVDTYFAGLISTDAQASLSLSFPVFFIILAFFFGISIGTTALIANALGAGDKKKSRLYPLQAISFSVLISVFLGIALYIFAPYLFMLLGAEGNYLKIVTDYINIILLGTVFFALTSVINGILNSKGDTKTYRNFLVVGFFLNCILDPIFVFGLFGFPAIGLTGVAWATILIEFFGVIYMGSVLVENKVFSKAKFSDFIPKINYYKEIFKQGFPASINMLTVAIGIFIITYFIAPFGKEAVAAYGIATRIDQIALLPSIGLNTAAIALIGQSNGAKKYNRCREIYNKILFYGFFLGLIGFIFVFLLANQLMNFFTNDVNVVKIGVHYLYISVFIYWGYIILFSVTSILQGLKKPNFALRIGLYRQIVAPIIFFYTFTKIILLGLDGVWIGIFLINWSAVVISLIYSKSVIKKLPNQ